MARQTWDERELPILTALVEMLDEGGSYIEPPEIAQKTGLDERTVQLGLRALSYSDIEYIDVTTIDTQEGREVFCVNQVTGASRRLVGTWPSPEGRAAEIIAAIEKVADRAPDEDTRGRLRRVAAYLGTAGRDLLVDVAGSAIAKGTGLS